MVPNTTILSAISGGWHCFVGISFELIDYQATILIRSLTHLLF